MTQPSAEDELTVVGEVTTVDEGDDEGDRDRQDSEAPTTWSVGAVNDRLESLRDEFVDAFNARDLDAITELVAADVECPDFAMGHGSASLAAELEAIWERSPSAVLTRAFVDGQPCAVAWLPDGEGDWSRAALVCFDVTAAPPQARSPEPNASSEDELLGLIELPDAPHDLERAAAERPSPDDVEEWRDSSSWDYVDARAHGRR